MRLICLTEKRFQAVPYEKDRASGFVRVTDAENELGGIVEYTLCTCAMIDKLNEQDNEIFQLKRIIKKYCPPFVWETVKLGDHKKQVIMYD